MFDAQPLKGVREGLIVPPGPQYSLLFPSLKSGLLAEVLGARLSSRLQKYSPGGKQLASGAEARTHFQRLSGTTEVVPFPTPG